MEKRKVLSVYVKKRKFSRKNITCLIIRRKSHKNFILFYNFLSKNYCDFFVFLAKIFVGNVSVGFKSPSNLFGDFKIHK